MRHLGSEKEQMAAEYLQENGYQILHRNFYSRYGEIDLVAREGNVLVFCEVKYRKNVRRGYPVEAVSPQKLLRMRKTAEYYCLRYRVPSDQAKRFDVISILGDEIRLYRNVTGG